MAILFHVQKRYCLRWKKEAWRLECYNTSLASLGDGMAGSFVSQRDEAKMQASVLPGA